MMKKSILFLLTLILGCSTSLSKNQQLNVPRQAIVDVKFTHHATTVDELIEECDHSTDKCHRIIFGFGYAIASRLGKPYGEKGACVSIPLDGRQFRSEIEHELKVTSARGAGIASATVVVHEFIKTNYTCVIKESSNDDNVIDLQLTIDEFLDACEQNRSTCEATFFYVAGRLNDAMRADNDLFFSRLQNFCPSQRVRLDLRGLFLRKLSTYKFQRSTDVSFGNEILLNTLVSDMTFENRCYLYEAPVLPDDALELF